MDPASESEAGRGTRPRKAWRLWAALVGGLVLFVLVFDLLERLVSPEPAVATQAVGEEAATPGPVHVDIGKLGEHGMRIEVGERMSTVITVDGIEGDVDDAIACIRAGIERYQAASPAPSALVARRAYKQELGQEAIRLEQECTPGSVLPPIPPSRPTTPERSE